MIEGSFHNGISVDFHKSLRNGKKPYQAFSTRSKMLRQSNFFIEMKEKLENFLCKTSFKHSFAFNAVQYQIIQEHAIQQGFKLSIFLDLVHKIVINLGFL